VIGQVRDRTDRVDDEANVVDDSHRTNKAALYVHSSIHRARPEESPLPLPRGRSIRRVRELSPFDPQDADFPNTFLKPMETAPGEVSGGRFHQLTHTRIARITGTPPSQSWPARPRAIAILEADLAYGSAFGTNTVHALSTCELARAYIASRAAYSASAIASNAKSIASYA